MESTTMISFKRGDTLDASCVYQDENDRPASLDGITITSQIRTPKGVLVADCGVTITNEGAGEFNLVVPAEETALWPIGKLEWDIKYALDGGAEVRTETVCVSIVREVTE